MKKKEMIRISDLPAEEFRRWQLKILDILIYFRDFCIEHNLKFVLSSGTCLGAVRHKGFIPWDDDVDVAMPRPDYDKLMALWNQYADLEKFQCCQSNKKQSIGFPMILIRSCDTTCIYEHSKKWDICHGLKIDVEHLDGMPNGKIDRICQYISASALALFRAQRVPNQKPFLIKMLSKVILVLFPTVKLRYRMSVFFENVTKKVDYNTSEYVRYLTCPAWEKKYFDDIIWVEFEGTTMPIPADYDNFLKAMYGNYMELPLKEKRKPITKCLFYDLNNSYKRYKGIYYCK